MFSVRLVKADYYMSTPIPGLDARYSEFRGVEVKQVPVIRIFGSTGSGQKVCLHLHGVFPYIYIPYDGCIEKEKFVYQIAAAVDKALNVSLGNSNSRTQHVYKVTHVSAVPFYGYHSQNHQFLKIYFYNPVMIKKASDLLQNGVILGQVFQPHEAHIPFILQFCMDYNLHGMSFVNLASVRYRQGIIEGSNYKPARLENVPEEFLLPEHILRISTCSLEVDGVAADILNRQDISGQLTSNPGLKAIWDEEKERRRKENRNSQFTPQNTQTRQPSQTASEKFHLGRLKKRLSEVALLNETATPTMEKSPGEKPKPYPAPTPDGNDYLNASVLLTHVNSLCHEKEPEKYAVEKMNDTLCEEEGKTGMYAHSDSSHSEAMSSQSSVLNSQCLSLVQILQDLIEDDSVLGSQQQEADGGDIERESDDEVLSQSLDSKESKCGNSPDSHLRSCGTRRDSRSSSAQDCFVLLQVDGANDVLKEEDEVNQVQLNQEDTQPVQQEILNPALPESEMCRDSGILPLLPCDDSVPLYIEPEILPENELKVQTGSDVDCKEEGMKIGALLSIGLSGNADDFTNEQSEDYLLNIDQPNEEKSGYFSEPASIDSAVGTDQEGLAKCLLLGDPWLTAQPASSEKDEFLDENFSAPLKDPWAIDTENSGWIPASEKYFSETSMIALPEVDVSSQYETVDLAELSVNKKSEPTSVTSSETKRRLCSLIKSRTKARELQSSDKMNSELISVDEIVNSEATCATEFENSTFSTIFQGSDYEQFLDDSCSILNGVDGSFLNESGLGNDMKMLGSSAIEEYNKSKEEFLDDMCNRLREGLGEAVMDHSHNTSKPKKLPLFPHLNRSLDETVARQWLLESRNSGGLKDNVRNSKVNCIIPGSRRRGRKPKWLKELEMKLSSFEQVEDVKKKVENNYQLRNRGPNVNKRGKKAKHLNEQVQANQNESASASVSESPVQCQDPKNIDNRSVKERLGILVRNSMGKKHSRKKSSLEEEDCSHIPCQNNRLSLSTSLASETLVQSEECLHPSISSSALHVTKKEENSFTNNDSLQNACQIKEDEECDDNKFDITATCLTELSLQFDEHEVNSSTIDIHETTSVVGDNVKEDVELAKKRMGQYVRQRLGKLVESRSKLCSKSTDEALTLKVPNPVFETNDNNSKVLKRHHRNRRKVVKSVEMDTPITEKGNVSKSQTTGNNPSAKKSEIFSNCENNNAVNNCTEDVSSFEKTTLLESNSPIKITTADAVSPIVNSAPFVNSSKISSISSSLQNELQKGSILISKEKDPKESCNVPDQQYPQSVEALLNLYSIQRCYVKLQKCNLNECKKVNSSKCVDEIHSFNDARRKTSLNLHDENLMSTTDEQRSSEIVNENELIKMKRNEKHIDSCSFQSVLLANTAPEFARSLFDHNIKLHCSESNMKCVVPNSPKSLDKSIRKTGDLGSLKAVVQAESPRVADTLDTLPDNPAQTIRHYALGGGTFIDNSENQSVHLVGGYLRDGNIVEVAKIPSICYAENRSDKTCEENDLTNMINNCSTSSETKEDINSNKDDAFKNSDCEFLTFTRSCPRKRSLMSDEKYVKKRGKINEANPSKIASVTFNDFSSPILESREVNFEEKSVEYVSENTGKEEFEENSKNEFLNNDKQLTSNKAKPQCLRKEFAEISSGIQLPVVTEDMPSFILSKDHVTCLDKPQSEFIEPKVFQVTNNESVHQKMLCKKRKLQIVPKNASRIKSHSVLRLHKRLNAANKYQAIKSVSLKRSRRLATLKKSISITRAENKWFSPTSSNEKIDSNSKSYYNTCANHETKWNSLLWSKRISSSYKNIYHNLYEEFESKPNAVTVKDKLTDKIQSRQVSTLNTNSDNKDDGLKETHGKTRQKEGFWKNASDMKLQSALKQPQVQNSEFKLPSIKENLNRLEMIKHKSDSPMRETVSRLQRSCVSKKKLSTLKHCKRISSANLSISGMNNQDLPENVKEIAIESEMEKDLSNNVKLKFAPSVNKSLEALQSNKISKNVCNNTNVIKEPSRLLRSENKLLEDEQFSRKNVLSSAPETVFDRKMSTFGSFQNTQFKKKCYRVGFNTSKHSKRITSSNRVNCTLMNNGWCESVEEKTKFDEDIPFDINLVSDTPLSTSSVDVSNILHKNSSETCLQSASKVQNNTERKVRKDSKTVRDEMMRMSKENRKAKLNSLKCLNKFTSPNTCVSGFSSKDSAKSEEQLDKGKFLRKTEPEDDSAILMLVHTVNKDCEKLQRNKLLENGIIRHNTSSKEQSSENVLGVTGMANYETGLQSGSNVALSENNLKRSKRIACAKKCILTPGRDVLDTNSEVTTSDIKPEENSYVVLKLETCQDLAKNIEKMDRGTELKELCSASCTIGLTANNSNENWQSSKLLENGTICDNKSTSSKEHSFENELMEKIGMTIYETSLQSVSIVASHEKAQPSSSVLQNTLSSKKYPTLSSNSLKRSKRIASAKKSISDCSKNIENENMEATACEIKPEESSSFVLKPDPQKNRDFSNTICKSSAVEERNTSKIQLRSSQPDSISIQHKLKKKTVSSNDETDLQYTKDLLRDKTHCVSSLLQNSYVTKKCTTVVKPFKRSERIASAQKFNSLLNTSSWAENVEQTLRKKEHTSLTVNLRSNSLLRENCEGLPNVTLNENAAQGGISVVESRMDHSEVQSVRNKLPDNAVSSPEATDLLNTQKHQAVLMTPGRQKKHHKAKLLFVNQCKSLSSSKKSYSAQNINRIFENLEQRTEGIFEENLPVHSNLRPLLSSSENTSKLNSLEAQSLLDHVEIQSAKSKFCKNISSNYLANFGNIGTTSLDNKAHPTTELQQKRSIHKNHAGVLSSLKRSKRIASVKKSISGSDNITENVETGTIISPTERSVSTDRLLTKDSMLSAKVGNKYCIDETIYKKEMSDRVLKIIPQSNSLCSQEQNAINEQISITKASPNERSNCQNSPKYSTFRVNTRSRAGLINCNKMKHHSREINSHVFSDNVLSTKKTTFKNFEEKSEGATMTQSVSGNLHSSQVSFINVGNHESRLKNIREKRNKNELECDDNGSTIVQLKQKHENKNKKMQSTENKLSSQIVSPLHSEVTEKKRKSHFISKLHQKADVNNKYRAIKLISVKRSMRVSSTPKSNSANLHNSCKDYVVKAIITSEVDNNVKEKSRANKHKLNPLDMQRKRLSVSTLSLNPTSHTSNHSENSSIIKSHPKNTSVHLRNPIIKLNPLNCFKRVPADTSLMSENKNKTDNDFDTQTHETESTNVSVNIQERLGSQLNEKVCNESEKNKEGHCEIKQICKSEHSMNVQSELNHSNFQNAECNNSLGQMTTNNPTVCRSTSIKKGQLNSGQHLKTHTNRKSQNKKLNQPKVFKQKDSFSELTHEQDLCNKSGVDEELKIKTKLSEIAVNTNIKRNISTKSKLCDHTLKEIHEEVAQSKEFNLEPSEVVSSKSGNKSISNTLSGGKSKIEKEEQTFVISEDAERVTKELQTSIPCVDGANDSIDTDNSNDFMPLTVGEQKCRKRKYRQVLNINDLTCQEPSVFQNCGNKSTRYEGQIKIPVKDSSAKPSKKENFKPVGVGKKMTSLNSKMLRRHQLHSSVQLAVGATEPEPMTQAILMKYLSSVLKRTVTKRDVKKFQPHVKLKRLNYIDIHSSRFKRRKLINEMCICVEHCAKGKS